MITYSINEKEFLEYKKKVLARRALNKAIRDGEVLRSSNCEVCSRMGKMQGHHTDYGRPLDVIWLCTKCHSETKSEHHPLNHAKFQQTMGVNLMDEERIPITLSLRTDAFIALKKASYERDISPSKLLESMINERYPSNNQLKFKFEEEENETSSTNKHKVLSCMGMDEERCEEQKTSILQKLWSQRNYYLPGMGKELCEIYVRCG